MKKGGKIVTLALSVAMMLSLAACKNKDKVMAAQTEIGKQIVNTINAEQSLGLTSFDVRNMTKTSKSKETVNFHLVAKDKESTPYFIKMEFKSDELKSNNSLKLVNYINSNYKDLEKDYTVTKINENIVDYVNSLSGTKENSITKTRNAFRRFESGVINSINFCKFNPNDKNLTFEVNATVKESYTYTTVMYIKSGDTYIPIFNTYTGYASYDKTQTVTVPMTDEYRDHPELAAESYLSAVASGKSLKGFSITEEYKGEKIGSTEHKSDDKILDGGTEATAAKTQSANMKKEATAEL